MWTSGCQYDADQRCPRGARDVTSIGRGQLPPGHGSLSGGLGSLALPPPGGHPPSLSPPPHAGNIGLSSEDSWSLLNLLFIELKVEKQEQVYIGYDL